MKCDHLINDRDILGYDYLTRPSDAPGSLECLRKMDHEGPHLVRRYDWVYCIWDKDFCSPGDCVECDSDDPGRYCIYYAKITSARAVQQYLQNSSFGKDE